MFKLYRELDREEQFVIYGDPSEGRDFCAAAACSKKHADIPFVFNAQVKSAQFGYELEKMAKFIHRETNFWPTIGVERNMGQATIHVLNTLNYPMMYRMTYFDSSTQKMSEKMGYQLTEGSRRKLLDDFALALRQRTVTIYDKETFKQMKTFVLRKTTMGSTLKPQAESGCYDDLVIANAGAYQLYLTVPLQFTEEDETYDDKAEKEKWRFK